MSLHSENFDICRICMLEPESNRHIPFIPIFEKNTDCSGPNIQQQIYEYMRIKVCTLYNDIHFLHTMFTLYTGR